MNVDAIVPVRLQLKRRKNFVLQEVSRALNGLAAVNCARPGWAGNPFHHLDNGARMCTEHAARHYRAQLLRFGYVVNDHGQTITCATIIYRCAGKNCACFCALGAPWCHVDTILEVANAWRRPIAGSGFARELEMIEAARANAEGVDNGD